MFKIYFIAKHNGTGRQCQAYVIADYVIEKPNGNYVVIRNEKKDNDNCA